MTIHYNVTGAERKSLVGAISHELNAQTKYLGAPTFAYEVGGYSIDRTGTLTGEDNRELVADLQGLHSFTAVSDEYDTPETESEEYPDIDQHHPGQYADPNVPPTEAMLRQAEAWMEGHPDFESLQLTEREELGLGRERRDPMGEDGMQASDVPETDETGGLAIEMPLEGFTATALDNLEKLVASKAALIKKAIGVDALPVERTETTLRFPWFTADTPGDDINAYAQFIAALCETAKEHKRVTAKEKEVDNEKFAFRVFLIRLGFIGGEYKAARKILMRNLSGNSAFKNSVPPRPSTGTDEPDADETDTAETNASDAPVDVIPDEKISA